MKGQMRIAIIASVLVCIGLIMMLVFAARNRTSNGERIRESHLTDTRGRNDAKTETQSEERVVERNEVISQVVGTITSSETALPHPSFLAAISPFILRLFRVKNEALVLVDTKTTSTDRFSFAGLTRGDYSVECMSSVYRVYGSERFAIQSDTPVVEISVALSRTVGSRAFRIFGKLDIDGEPARGSRITMRVAYANGWRTEWRFQTDEDGGYSYATSGPEPFTGEIRCHGALPLVEVFEMAPGAFELEKDIFLRGSPIYSGAVVTPWGEPVAPAKLFFERKTGEGNQRFRASTYTEEDGGFVVSGCPPGEYTVSISKIGWKEEDNNVDVVTKYLKDVTLCRDEKSLDIEVDTAKSMTLEVRDGTGAASGAGVFLLEFGGASELESHLFRPSPACFATSFMVEYAENVQEEILGHLFGRFSISYLPEKWKSVRVTCISGRRGSSIGEAVLSEDRNALVVLNLQPAVRFVSVVSDWHSQPVGGVRVEYTLMPSREERMSGIPRTGQRFMDELRSVTNAQGEIIVWVYSHIDSEIVYVFPSNGRLRLRDPRRYVKYTFMSIRSPVLTGLAGCVMDSHGGKPVSGVVVRARLDRMQEESAATDVDGWFLLESVERREGVKLEFMKPGYRTLEAMVSAGSEDVLVFELERM